MAGTIKEIFKMGGSQSQGIAATEVLGSAQEYAAAALAEAARAAEQEPVTEATYKKATETFGVMRQTTPVFDHLIASVATLKELRAIATTSPSSTGKALLDRIEAFLRLHLTSEEYDKRVREIIDTEHSPSTGGGRFFTRKIPTLMGVETMPKDIIGDGMTLKERTVSYVEMPHTALFKTSTVLTEDIRAMEALRTLLVEVRRTHQQEFARLQDELAALEARLPVERGKLDGLEERRKETLDDYAVGQRLLTEHWQDVERACARRKEVIEGSVGLAYVRVRETPLSRTLPDPLDLRFAADDDLVPGCPAAATPLRSELHPLMEMLLDVPAADWGPLHELSSHLPDRLTLEQMVRRKRQRLSQKLSDPTAAATGHQALQPLLQHGLVMARGIMQAPFVMGNLRQMQLQGHAILSLEDLLALPIPALRDPAVTLHQHLLAAAGCILERLRPVKPSLRLEWSLRAERGTLPVQNAARWPGLEQAEGDDFNNIRTLVELVDWWFRQLDSGASADSKTAMALFIRACLMLSAGDNPRQLLQGAVKSPPARFLPGQLLRVALDGEPPPGNLLHLLDDNQRVIATLRVEDHDENGTTASIATVLDAQGIPAVGMRVTGTRS